MSLKFTLVLVLSYCLLFWVHVGRSFTYVPNLTKKSHGALCIPDHPVHTCILIEFISQHMRFTGQLYSKFSFGEVYRQIYGGTSSDIQRYIVRYTVRNLVLRRRACRARKCDFRTYIR